jgi:large subunit ribosomal protein L17
MRHKIKRKKLNKTSSHRKAMFANMAVALVLNEQIKTTVAKAKCLKPYVEQLVTKAKKRTLAGRRDIISRIKDKIACEKLISVLGERYNSRSGGYTRIIKAGFRYGDRAPMAYIEFIDRDVNSKGCMTPKDNKLTEQEVQE